LNLLQEKDGIVSSGMFSGDDKIVDHPMGLNLEDLNGFLFGEDKEASNDGGDVSVESVDCGASGTAMVLNDGRCFVMGTNKNGELG